MKFSSPERQCAKSDFQIQPSISGVDLSNNMTIPQVRVNMRETEHGTTFETS